MNEERQIIRMKDVAELLGVSRSQVNRYIKDHGLPCVQVVKGGLLTFNRDGVISWWKGHKRR